MTEQDKIIEMAKTVRSSGYWDAFDLINFAKLVAKAKAEEIANACERLPFGDTAHSFAIWIREQ
jgi:hypothetical protein